MVWVKSFIMALVATALLYVVFTTVPMAVIDCATLLAAFTFFIRMLVFQ